MFRVYFGMKVHNEISQNYKFFILFGFKIKNT